MKTIMNLIRNGLGYLVAFFDRFTRPEPIERSEDEQRQVEEEVEGMALYQFYGCPFCVKVRRAVHRLNLPLEYRDAQSDPDHRAELREGGGEVQVPCLRIERGSQTEWMYESDDIIAYLEQKFG